MNQSYDLGPANLDHLTAEDVSYLNALAPAHYVFGSLVMMSSLALLVPVFLGLAIVSGIVELKDVPPFDGWLVFGAGLIVLVLCATMAIAMILSGRHMKRRTGYTFSFAVACISCCIMPFGTILGIFTILVLNRPAVKAAYGKR